MKKEANKVGRPPKYNDPDLMLKDGLEYINSKQYPTVTGLCLALGFESRQSFYDYQNIEKFTYTIKTLRMHIEVSYEERLTDKEFATAGVIFALKNLGWKDTQEVENNVNINTVSIKDLVKFK